MSGHPNGRPAILALDGELLHESRLSERDMDISYNNYFYMHMVAVKKYDAH